jgi:hypothetical protein
MHLVYAESGLLDVIDVTLDGEGGHIPKSSHKRCCFQKLGRPWQGGAYAKSPENARNRVGGAPS